MDNSVETILGDIKKLVKEAERAYGKVKPQICEVVGVEKCPNTKCWVQQIRDEYNERICDLERVILISINGLSELRTVNPNININNIIATLDQAINPTPCNECVKNNSCQHPYKNQTIHSEPCSSFSKSFGNKEQQPDVAVHF